MKMILFNQRTISKFYTKFAYSAFGILLAINIAHAQDATDVEADTVIAELVQILAAAESYRKDTGQVLPITSNTNIKYGYLKISNLVEAQGVTNWQGPYLPYDRRFARNQYLSHPRYNSVQLLAKEDGEWIVGSAKNGCRQSSENCVIAACMWELPTDIPKKINYKIDGVNSSLNEDATGKVRFESGLVCLQGGSYPQSKSPVQ